MAITINGTTGIAGVDGSASTPALQGSDTNTGIVFPAADTVAVATGGTERMRLDSSGNVGIGTTSPGSKLDVKGTLRLSGSTSGYVGLAPAAAAGSTTYTLPSADGSSGQVLSTNGSGTLSWATDRGVAPTTQIFTSGSGTYTTPANCKAIWVRVVGGGGGGGGSGNAGSPANGTTGGNSTFSTLTANGGVGGPNSLTGGFAGGAGGNSSGGDINSKGGPGQTVPGNTSPALYQGYGGNGGNSAFGGGGVSGSNGAGATGGAGSNYGGGGGGVGGDASTYASTGGGAGGYCEKLITSLSSSYSYAVGAGGAGGASGTGGGTGGAGSAGVIIVMEFY